VKNSIPFNKHFKDRFFLEKSMNPGPHDYNYERSKDYLTKKPVGNKFPKAKKEFWMEKNIVAKKLDSPGFKY